MKAIQYVFEVKARLVLKDSPTLQSSNLQTL